MIKKQYLSFAIAFCTTIVQCYDYALFGFSAAILAQNFMPEGSNLEKISGFFVIFGLSSIARPVGSLIFGAIADHYGRAVSIKIAIVLAALSTTLLGIMPGFAVIGWLAPTMLMLCRMVFLMSLTGKSDAVRVYIFEKVSSRNRNFANGAVSFCTQIGALLAAFACRQVADSEIEGIWRLNFLIGGSCGAVLMLLGNYITESEEFIEFKKKVPGKKYLQAFSLLELVRIIGQNRTKFILAIIISGSVGGIFHFFIIFLGTFAANVLQLISLKEAQTLNISLIASYCLAAPLSGFMADRFGVGRQVMVATSGSAVVLLLVIAGAALLPVDKIIVPLYISAVLLTIAITFYAIPLQIMQQAMFTVDIRARMFSLSHSFGSIIFSATAPFVCTLIWSYTGSLVSIISYITLLVFQLIVAIIFLLKLSRRHSWL